MVSLTFDAGDDRGYAASILDTLAAKGIKASFGMTGKWAAANGDLVRRIADEGHHLFNHTLTHRSFTGLSTGGGPLTPSERLAELVETEDRVVGLTGRTTQPWFRPPYGDYDAGVLRDIATVGYRQNVMWSVDSLGWNGLTRDQVVARCLASHGNGYIYLLHVGAASQDGPALSGIIDGLRAKGYAFGTVPEVIAGTVPASASCAIAPASGAVGSVARVTCRGFASGETVAIHWGRVGSTPLASARASSAGVATVEVVVPKGAMGRYTVSAVGAASGRRATAAFTVVPSIRLSPTSGPAGTAVTTTLRGYAAYQAVTIVWHHAASTATVATVTTSYSGSASVGFTVPASHVGAHVVAGVGGSSGGRAEASFAVSPSLTLSPTAGAPGAAVRATLRGFGRYETIRVTWNGAGVATETLLTVAASATGSATVILAVPPDAGVGEATVTATGASSGATVARPFAVTALAAAAEPTATPESTPTAPATATEPPTAEPSATAPPQPTTTPTPESTATDPAAPTVTTVEVETTEPTRVVLRIVAAGAASVTVDVGLDTAYGTMVAADNGGDGAYYATLEPLVPGTVYHYRVVAAGPGGTTATEDVRITTAAAPDPTPTVTA